MKRDEIQAFFLLPVRKATALPDAHFTEPWLYCPVNGRRGCGLRRRIWFSHKSEFYANSQIRSAGIQTCIADLQIQSGGIWICSANLQIQSGGI